MTVSQFDIFTRAVAYVAIKCCVPVSVLDSSCRREPVFFARCVVIWILRHQAEMTHEEIGRLMNRSTGAVWNSLRALDNWVETDGAVGRQVAGLVRGFTKEVPNEKRRVTMGQARRERLRL
jgi:chromosomal replication initiation ATPase DnaA